MEEMTYFLLTTDEVDALTHAIAAPVGGLAARSHTFRLRRYADTFTGIELVLWLTREGIVEDVQTAKVLGNQLLSMGRIHRVPAKLDKNKFTGTKRSLYRMSEKSTWQKRGKAGKKSRTKVISTSTFDNTKCPTHFPIVTTNDGIVYKSPTVPPNEKKIGNARDRYRFVPYATSADGSEKKRIALVHVGDKNRNFDGLLPFYMGSETEALPTFLKRMNTAAEGKNS